jgi:hypothetical protein
MLANGTAETCGTYTDFGKRLVYSAVCLALTKPPISKRPTASGRKSITCWRSWPSWPSRQFRRRSSTPSACGAWWPDWTRPVESFGCERPADRSWPMPGSCLPRWVGQSTRTMGFTPDWRRLSLPRETANWYHRARQLRSGVRTARRFCWCSARGRSAARRPECWRSFNRREQAPKLSAAIWNFCKSWANWWRTFIASGNCATTACGQRT